MSNVLVTVTSLPLLSRESSKGHSVAAAKPYDPGNIGLFLKLVLG